MYPLLEFIWITTAILKWFVVIQLSGLRKQTVLDGFKVTNIRY